MNAREEILARIRGALHVQASDPAASHTHIARAYNRAGALTPEARMHLFLDRLIDYDTEVIELASEAEIPDAIMRSVVGAGEQTILTPRGFPCKWLLPGLAAAIDDDLPIDTINAADAVVTTCEAAVAATGTIFLAHGPSQGRRVLTLLPDHHICVVRRDQVFELLPEALAHMASKAAGPITTISGPSATSDIEMTRIKGVHGPRRLTAILYGEPRP